MDLLLSFALTSLIIELTPGPNMAYLAILSATEGRRAGFSAVLGVAAGLLIIGIIAAYGVAALIAESPFAYEALRWCGAFYLLWLAWDGWHSVRETSPGTLHDVKFFQRGLITNILNPKAALFYITVLPGFVGNSLNIQMQAVTLTIIYVCVATAIHSVIVAVAGSAQAFLENPRRSLIVRRGMSLALAGVAVWFLISTGRAF